MDMNFLRLYDNWQHSYELGNGSLVKKMIIKSSVYEIKGRSETVALAMLTSFIYCTTVIFVLNRKGQFNILIQLDSCVCKQ